MPSLEISADDAIGRLPELLRRAEAGDDVILTLQGETRVRLVPIKRPVSLAARRRVLEAARGTTGKDGPPAARSQDFLYDDDGLPA